MAKFPSLPSSVDKYVREIINRMLGRTGTAGEMVVLREDLEALGVTQSVNGGLTQPAKNSESITDTLQPVTPGTIPGSPVTPKGLSATGTLGAVVLGWTPPVYEGHAHTEVWRAQEDDREQATLVHLEPGSLYTDVIGSATAHYYWIRHVNSAGQHSGFNQLSGTLGHPTIRLSIADLILEHPEIAVQPYTVINRGTEAEPDFVMVMNADIAVNGQVNISQLQSGELANGTALTVGDGSIELATGSDGYGQLVITGSGGIAGNDYMVLKQGTIESFVYTAASGHVPYKEVRRVETGTAESGQQVVIPAYFKSQPNITMYPRDVSVYNAAYPAQSQRLEISHTPPEPHPTVEGAWLFTPTARLILADGVSTVSHGWTYTGSDNDESFFYTNINNLTGVTVNGRVASHRHTGSGNTYKNRQVTVILYYRVSGTGSWSEATRTTVNVSQFNNHNFSLNTALSNGTYDIQVRYISADRSGSFTSGALQYEYTSRAATGGNVIDTLGDDGSESNSTRSLNVSINMPSMSGWEVTRIDYAFTVSGVVKARRMYTNASSIDTTTDVGIATLQTPNNSGGHTVTQATVTDNFVGSGDYYNTTTTLNEHTVNWSDSSYRDGTVRPPVVLSVEGNAGYDSTRTYLGKIALATVSVTNVTATVYYRRVQTNPDTNPTNTLALDSGTYNKGATDISVTNAVLNWTATGD